MATTGTAVLDFGATAARDARLTVTGQSAITAGSYVEAFIFPNTATADHSVDEQFIEAIDVRAGNIVAGAGFDIYGFAEIGTTYGKFNIGWVYT